LDFLPLLEFGSRAENYLGNSTPGFVLSKADESKETGFILKKSTFL